MSLAQHSYWGGGTGLVFGANGKIHTPHALGTWSMRRTAQPPPLPQSQQPTPVPFLLPRGLAWRVCRGQALAGDCPFHLAIAFAEIVSPGHSEAAQCHLDREALPPQLGPACSSISLSLLILTPPNHRYLPGPSALGDTPHSSGLPRISSILPSPGVPKLTLVKSLALPGDTDEDRLK